MDEVRSLGRVIYYYHMSLVWHMQQWVAFCGVAIGGGADGGWTLLIPTQYSLEKKIPYSPPFAQRVY